VRQLAAALAQASLLAVHRIVVFGAVKREQARRRKAAASCRTPARLRPPAKKSTICATEDRVAGYSPAP
ncbi:MAG: hypothetical protein WB763_09585, partial [Terriglobia bacterium]